MAETDVVAICSEALVHVGEAPIESRIGSGIGQVVSNNLYASTVRALIASHPWTFARRYVRLSRLSGVPLGPWSAAYQRPDCLEVRGLFVGGRAIDYEASGDVLLCDAGPDDVVEAQTVFVPDEALWTAAFRMAVIYSLASKFAVAVAESADRAKIFMEQAEIWLRRARGVNAQNTATPVLNADLLIGDHR